MTWSFFVIGIVGLFLAVLLLFWIFVDPPQERCPTCGRLVSLDTMIRRHGVAIGCELCSRRLS